MAEANNAGANQQGTGSQSGGTDDKGGTKKKYGKWDTLEELAEHGYGGLEKGFGEMKEQIASLVQVIETAMTPDPNASSGAPHVDTSGQGGRSDEGYGRQGDVNAADFLVNPNKYLDEREEKLEKRITTIVGKAVNGAMAVSDFKTANPDLVQHEKIVQTFMRDTDTRKPLAERFKDAAKATREFLARVRTEKLDGGGDPPKGKDYVETPRGGNPPAVPNKTDEQQKSEDEELAEHIRELNARSASHFGASEQPKDK